MKALASNILNEQKKLYVTPAVKIGIEPYDFPQKSSYVSPSLFHWKLLDGLNLFNPLQAVCPIDGSLIVLDANLAYGKTTKVNTGIYITNGGSNYWTSPFVALTPYGQSYPITTGIKAQIDGQGHIIAAPASIGYTSGGPSAISFMYVGSGATAGTVTIVNGVITAIAVNTQGTGYSVAPDIVISGGGGTGATATAVIANGRVTTITVTYGGTGYNAQPTVYIGGSGGGAGATGIWGDQNPTAVITQAPATPNDLICTSSGGNYPAALIITVVAVGDVDTIRGQWVHHDYDQQYMGSDQQTVMYSNSMQMSYSDMQITANIDNTNMGGPVYKTWTFHFSKLNGHKVGDTWTLSYLGVVTPGQQVDSFNDLICTGTPTKFVGVTYLFTITATGTGTTPDKYTWLKQGDNVDDPTEGILSDEIDCSLSPVLIEDGLYVTFKTINGHRTGTTWQSTIVADYSSYTVRRFVDANGDGQFAPTGTPLSLTGINANQPVSSSFTDAQGNLIGQAAFRHTIAIAANPNSQEVIIAAWTKTYDVNMVSIGPCYFYYNSTTVLGMQGSTHFTTLLKSGDAIGVNSTDGWWEVDTVVSDYQLTLKHAYTGAYGSLGQMMYGYTGRTLLQVKSSSNCGQTWGSWAEIYTNLTYPRAEGNIAIGMNDYGNVGLFTNLGYCGQYYSANSITLTRTSGTWTTNAVYAITATDKQLAWDSVLGWYFFTAPLLTGITGSNQIVDTTPSTVTINEMIKLIQPPIDYTYRFPIIADTVVSGYGKGQKMDAYGERNYMMRTYIQQTLSRLAIASSGDWIQISTNLFYVSSQYYIYVITKDGLSKVLSSYHEKLDTVRPCILAYNRTWVLQIRDHSIYYTPLFTEWTVPTIGAGAGAETQYSPPVIASVKAKVHVHENGQLAVTFMNNDGAFDAGIAKGSRVRLYAGYNIGGVDYTNELARFFVDLDSYSRVPNFNTYSVICDGAWGLLEKYKFPRPVRWNQFNDSGVQQKTYNVYQIIEKMVQAIGGTLTYESRSAKITSFYPKIEINMGETAGSVIRRLLATVSDTIKFFGNDGIIKYCQSSDSTVYDYKGA